MDKIKSSWLYFVLGVLLGSGFFLGLYGRVHAEEIIGDEAVFVHTHSAACRKTERSKCGMQHYMTPVSDTLSLHCFGCNTRVNAIVKADGYKCYETNVTWQQNGTATCPNCGNVISTWTEAETVHTYMKTVDACGITEGDKTTGISIRAKDDWTNEGVWLTASVTKYKNDAGNAALSYSWQDGEFYAEENGIYSVTVRNALGQTAEASITISCIDKIPPKIISVTGNTAGMTRDRIEVSVSADDEESGLAENAYSTDGGVTWGSGASFTVTEGMSLRILVRDRAGNTAERTVTRNEFPYPTEPASPPSAAPDGSDMQAGSSDMPGQQEQVPKPSSSASMEQETENSGIGDDNKKSQISGSNKNKEIKEQKEKEQSAEEETVSRKTLWQNQGQAYRAVYLTNMEEEVTAYKFRISRLEKESTRQRHYSEDAFDKEAEDGTGEKAVGSFWESLTVYGRTHASLLAGGGLVCTAVILLFRLLWLHSAVLYCYDGGEEYYRLALLQLKRRKKEFSLCLPEELLKEAKTPRYRLLLKTGLVKRFKSMDLVVESGTYKLRQPLEECVDFVL